MVLHMETSWKYPTFIVVYNVAHLFSNMKGTLADNLVFFAMFIGSVLTLHCIFIASSDSNTVDLYVMSI